MKILATRITCIDCKNKKALSRFLRPRASTASLIVGLRLERLLEVICANTCLRSSCSQVISVTDAVTLTKDRIHKDVLTLRTAKTGTDVRVPLPQTALVALGAIKTDNYYFWSGFGKKKSCVGDYQRAFKKLYELAEVENGHAHRWRDTFAVELLLSGMPLDQVGALLGHQSIKVTEKHYAPWVKARQEQLEVAVRKTF